MEIEKVMEVQPIHTEHIEDLEKIKAMILE